MKAKTRFFPHALLALLIVVSAVAASAQRLHDDARDKKAQEAAALAEEITSKSTFDKQLKNLDTLSKRDIDLHFQGARRQMELEIRGFRTWGKVSGFIGRVETTLNAPDFISDKQAQSILDDLKKDCPRTSDLGKAICAAQTELKNLNDAVAERKKQKKALDEELRTRLEKIQLVDSLVDKAETFLKSDSKSRDNQTISEVSDVLINLSKSFVGFTNKLQQIDNDQPKDELKLLLQRIAVETLQLEADHWQTVGEIKLRRVEEQKELSSMVRGFKDRLATIAGFWPCLPDLPDITQDEQARKRAAGLEAERIPETFTRIIALPARATCQVEGKPRGKEDLAAFVYQTLHLATALAARGETPMKLASLRLAQEEHAYSIRQSAIVARGYELAIGSGTKRLARFYAGGLRPEKIAQLIYTAATVAIPAVIAGQ
jgi:hypothetical protein